MNSLMPEMHLARSVGGSLRIKLHTALNYTSVLSTIAVISFNNYDGKWRHLLI